MEKIIVTTPEELSALLDERIRIAFKHYAPQPKQRQPDDTPGQAGEVFISKKQAARLLSCSPSTIDNHARAGNLARHYVGKSVRFDRKQVLALVRQHHSSKQQI